MPAPLARLEAVRAIGRPEADGPWIGFARRGDTYRLVVGTPEGVLDGPAETDLLLALAIAHFAQAFDGPPPELEATQSDLSALVDHLVHAEGDAARRALLAEALDAIDDGLAGDAVAGRLAAATTQQLDRSDPVELLVLRANELVAGG